VLSLALSPPAGGPLRVLCLGAHPDDIEIGCGGTVLTLTASLPVEVGWVVFSGTSARRVEAEASAGRLLIGVETAMIGGQER